MKRIIELSENDYKALKEDGVENHIALANTVIAYSVPYEPKKELVPVCKVTFDEEQLQEIVDKAKVEMLASIERPQDEWKVNKYGEHFCPKCGHYALYEEEQDNDYYEVQSNFCPECGSDLRGKKND